MTTLTVNNKQQIEVIGATTSSGKPCLAIVTNKRLSTEDFKSFMGDIQQAEGFGFTKYFPEHKAKLICAVKIEAPLLEALANAYQWSEVAPKAAKVATTPTKQHKQTKQTKKSAQQVATQDSGIDDETLAQWKAFQAFLKNNK
jgi:hypothetical protein